MFHKIVDAITGQDDKKKQIKGRVVLMKKNVLDFTDLSSSVVNRVDELLRRRVSFQLISSVNSDTSGTASCTILLFLFQMRIQQL